MQVEERATGILPQDNAKNGHELLAQFQEVIKKLEKKYHGKIAVIEVDSGDYFLGDTLSDADNKARAKFPNKESVW